MARGIDVSSLSPAERAVLAGGALLFLSGFIPWWFRSAGPSGAVTYNAGLTNWSAIAIGAGAVATVAVLARAAIWPEPAPRKDGALYTLLGLVAVATLGIEALSATGVWLGVYVGIAFGVILTAGGLRRRTERRSGWT